EREGGRGGRGPARGERRSLKDALGRRRGPAGEVGGRTDGGPKGARAPTREKVVPPSCNRRWSVRTLIRTVTPDQFSTARPSARRARSYPVDLRGGVGPGAAAGIPSGRVRSSPGRRG